MALEYRPPSFMQPRDYSAIPASIDQLFDTYQRNKMMGRQNMIQDAQLAGQGIDPNALRADPVGALRGILQQYADKRKSEGQMDQVKMENVQSDTFKNNAAAMKDMMGGKVGEQLSIKDKSAIEGQIMDDYMKSPTFANLAASKSGLRDLASIQENKSGAADIAAIYSFIKTMDNNAVKEGEINLAQSALPGLDRVKLVYDRMKAGNVLTPAMKRELLTVGRGMYESKLKSSEEFRAPFVQRANQYQINPDIAVPGFSIPKDEMDRIFGADQAPLRKTRKLKSGESVNVISKDGGATWQEE